MHTMYLACSIDFLQQMSPTVTFRSRSQFQGFYHKRK